jgi:DNA-binding NarL/FixJ family response regulator
LEKKQLKILVVEDVPALRQHACSLLKLILPAPVEIFEARSGSEGTRLASSLEPELIVMDISMPDVNGIKAAQQIWSQSPQRKILFWSQYHREAYIRELGKIVPDQAIHGYLLKNEPDEKFAFAVCSLVMHDVPYIDPVVRKVQSRLKSKSECLSDVEYECLLDVVLGLTDRAIAERRHISVRGAQNRLSMVIDKLLKGEENYLREVVGREVFNARLRVVFEATKRGLVDVDDLERLDKETREWLAQDLGYEQVEVS